MNIYLDSREDFKIKEFIKEYESRIKDCDKILDDNKEQNRRLRHGDVTVDELRAERMKEDAKRQAYVQFVVNLKELEEANSVFNLEIFNGFFIELKECILSIENN